MPYLYLAKSIYKLGCRDNQIVVVNVEDGSEQTIPISKIEGISVFGSSQLSTQLIRTCMEQSIPVLYYSEDGHYFGSIGSMMRLDPIRQKKQIMLTDDKAFCLQWSRNIVETKIRNSITLLESLSDVYGFSEEETRGLKHSLAMLDSASSINEILGYEGLAARSYFACLPHVLRNDGFKFMGRSSRPPRDPFNSMLSFGYSIMFRNIIGTIEKRGLHPYFAYMHQLKAGHAALASDLIEEYRAPLVDRKVIQLINNGDVSPEGFYTSEAGAIYMTKGVMRKLANAMSDAMVTSRQYFLRDGDRKAYGFQTMLDMKLTSLISAIEVGDASLYRPYIWKIDK